MSKCAVSMREPSPYRTARGKRPTLGMIHFSRSAARITAAGSDGGEFVLKNFPQPGVFTALQPHSRKWKRKKGKGNQKGALATRNPMSMLALPGVS